MPKHPQCCILGGFVLASSRCALWTEHPQLPQRLCCSSGAQVSLWFHPKGGGQVVCSQAAPQREPEGGERETSFEPKLLMWMITHRHTERKMSCSWNGSEAASVYSWHFKQTRGCVIWEAINSGCSGEIWPAQNECTQRLQIHHPFWNSSSTFQQPEAAVTDMPAQFQTQLSRSDNILISWTTPFPLHDGLCFQESSHHSAKDLVSFFLLCFPPLKSLRTFTQNRMAVF